MTDLDALPPKVALAMALDEKAKRQSARSLASFLKHVAWPVVQPATPLVWNWHIDAICEHLEAVTRRDIKRLLINVPFRTAKPVHVDELVLTSAGYKRLGDIKIGDMVLTHKGRFRAVVATHEQGTLPTVIVKTFAGRAVRAAPDHPFLTTRGWVNAGDLTTTDYVFDTEVGASVTDRVTSIEQSTPGECRCLTVAEDESFTAGNLIVHNSTITSVAWPAWSWINQPSHQWLCGSYAEKLAIRDSLRHRRLVTSSKYSQWWGEKFHLAGDQNEKRRFQNDKNGYRIAFGMTGGVMGDGGDTILIDDPHDRQGAHSEAERESALTTYDESLITRLNDPANGAIVIIMQRLHQKDLSGHVLKEKGWEHLLLPMEYEPARSKVTSIGFKDPRTKEGEILDAVRFPPRVLAQIKESLGEYGTAGQLQQRPSPAGGGILKKDQFRLWPANRDLPDFFFVLQSYDTAFTDRTSGDPTAHTVWGVFEQAKKRHVMLLDCWAEHLAYPALREKMMTLWRAKYGGVTGDPIKPARRADIILIEEKGSGISVKQELRQSGLPVVGYNPGKADKTARANMASPFLDADIVWVLESKRQSGEPVSWARPFLEQCEQFPNGENDDMVDTFTQAIIYLRDAGQLELAVLPEEQEEDHDYEADRPRENVYSL